MKIYVSKEAAQDVLGTLRNYGERATLLSSSQDRNESVIVVKSIPPKIKQWVLDIALRVVEDR